MSEGSYPISFDFDVEGDSEIQSKIKGVAQEVNGFGQAADEAAQRSANLGIAFERTGQSSATLTGEFNDYKQVTVLSSESTDHLGSSLIALTSEADNAKKNIDGAGNAIEQTGRKTEETSKKTHAFAGAMKESALGISAAASSATALYFQYDNLEKVQSRVDKAERTLTTAKASLITAQERLTKLTNEGVTSGADYEKAQLDLSAAQQGLQISTDRLSQAQGDLSQGQLNFALGVVPTVISTVSTLSTVMTSLRAAKIANIAATEGEAIADSGGVFAKAAHTGATIAHTIATNAATVATRLFEIAIGPVGWVILGVSGAMAAFATNAFGVRDAINSAGKAIGDAVPVMRPLLDTLSTIAKTLFPEASESAQSETEKMQKAFADMSSHGSASFGSFGTNTAAGADGISLVLNGLSDDASTAATGISDAFDQADKGTASSLASMKNNANATATVMQSAADKIKASMQEMGIRTAKEGSSQEQQYTTLQGQLLGKDRRAGVESQLSDITALIEKYKTYGIGNLNGDQQNSLANLIDKKTYAETLLNKDDLIQKNMPIGFTPAPVSGTIKVELTATDQLNELIKLAKEGGNVDLVFHSN